MEDTKSIRKRKDKKHEDRKHKEKAKHKRDRHKTYKASLVEKLPIDVLEHCLLLQLDITALLSCRLVSQFMYKHSHSSLCFHFIQISCYDPLLKLGEAYQDDEEHYLAAMYFASSAVAATPTKTEDTPNMEWRHLTTKLFCYQFEPRLGGCWGNVFKAVRIPKSKYFWCYALYRAATCWSALSQHQKALELLLPLTNVSDEDADLHAAVLNAIGFAYLTLGDTKPCKEDYVNTAITYYSQSRATSLTKYNIACGLALLKKDEEAKEALQTAFNWHDNSLPSKEHVLNDDQLISLRDWILQKYEEGW